MTRSRFRFLVCFAATALYFTLQAFSVHSGPKDVLLEIKPVFGDRKLVIGKEKYITKNGDTVSIDRMRFYISAVNIKFDGGQTYSEKDSYHLLDADSAALQIKLKNVPDGKISAIEFFIGIDSATSVSGAMGGDLDPMNGMYWAWNSGYINAKLEGKCSKCKNNKNAFEFHIGGYMKPNYALRSVSLPVKDVKEKITIAADASVWFDNINFPGMSSVVVPGKNAMKIADNYSRMFRITEE